MSKFITPKFRVSFPNLFEARRANPESKPKFSVVGLFTDDPEVPPGSISYAEMQKIAIQAALDKFGNTDDTKKKIKSGKIKMPFRKNDEGKYPEEYPYYITFSTDEKYRPGVVDRFKGPDGKPRVITDAADVYPGCFGRAAVTAFAYDTAGNKGVSFGLNNFQKLGEGDRLDNRVAAQNQFEAVGGDGDVGEKDLADDLLNTDDDE
jgi:hypothetical protein